MKFGVLLSGGLGIAILLSGTSLQVTLDVPDPSSLAAIAVTAKLDSHVVCRRDGDASFTCSVDKFGAHHLNVDSPGFASVSVPLRIYTPYVTAHVAFTPTNIGSDTSELNATVTGNLAITQPEWAKAVPVDYGMTSIESRIIHGVASFQGLDVGRYVLIVVNIHGSVICSKPVAVSHKTKIAVRLDSAGCMVVNVRGEP